MSRYVAIIAIIKFLGILAIGIDLGIHHGFAMACLAIWTLSSLEEIKGKV